MVRAWCVQVEAALEALLKKVLKSASKKLSLIHISEPTRPY